MMTATGFPPFEYLGEDGKPAGVDIDLAQLVADELGVELEVLGYGLQPADRIAEKR